MNQAGDLFEPHRLRQIFIKHKNASAQEIQSVINDAVFDFIGPIEPSDDVTMVVLKKA
jgi:serine phosphatase RsbU (regulator of sigma subunit)